MGTSGGDHGYRAAKSSQIAPASGPPTSAVKRRRPGLRRRLSVSATKSLASFSQAFGWLGVPMVIVVLVCISWTTWLIVLTLAPNATANYLMNTETYDAGQFWLIVDPDPAIKYLGVAGLVLIDTGYVYVLLAMTVWRQHASSSPVLTAFESRLNHWRAHRGPRSWRNLLVDGYERMWISWRELTDISGRNRKFWNVALKAIDLGVQSVQLHEVFERGFPPSLVRGYAVFLCCNSLSCALGILMARHSAMVEILVDSVFDLVAAVLYPILVLAYCYANFDFDRRSYALYLEVLPPGYFERLARTNADPNEIAFFLACFDSLRFLSLGNLALRVSMNLSLCNRFRGVVETILRDRAHAVTFKIAATAASRNDSTLTHSPQRRVPLIVASVFIAYGIYVVVLGEKSMAATLAVCAAYPQCVVYAHRWQDSESCPCLTLIDINRPPATYDEWMNPMNVTSGVQALAKSGDLKVLQVINQGLSRLPEELRTCRSLQYVSLIYTGLEEVPAWVGEFKELYYLHIEGKEMFDNLVSLDISLFSALPRLVFVHLGVHDLLRELPPLDGVPNLRSFTVAHMYHVTDLPSLDRVPKLQRLAPLYMPALRTLPDLTPVKDSLVDLLGSRAAEFCCNGFLGKCDLSHEFCTGNSVLGIPPAECLDPDNSSTSVTLSFVDKFSDRLCQRTPFDGMNASDLINRERINICDGVPFKQCEYPAGSGLVGMCIFNRGQVLACVVNGDYVRLRKAQIAAGLGRPCNVSNEAWLGCGSI